MNATEIFDLTGRAVVVTGAGGGLGTAICAGLAAWGADIALLDVNPEALSAAAAGVEATGRRALAIETDVSDLGAVERAFAEIDGALDSSQMETSVSMASAATPGAAAAALSASRADVEQKLCPRPTRRVAHRRGAKAASGSVTTAARPVRSKISVVGICVLPDRVMDFRWHKVGTPLHTGRCGGVACDRRGVRPPTAGGQARVDEPEVISLLAYRRYLLERPRQACGRTTEARSLSSKPITDTSRGTSAPSCSRRSRAPPP